MAASNKDQSRSEVTRSCKQVLGHAGSLPPMADQNGDVRVSPADVSLTLSADGEVAILETRSQCTIALPVAIWADVVAQLEAKVAAHGDRLDALAKPRFGPRPTRHGADWSVRELATLEAEFKAGIAVAALALAHQRSTGAVEAQLVKLGLITLAHCQYSGPRTRVGVSIAPAR